jgi:enamine deaminase RidA (YjgF/YER057c/UK114 family)
MQIEERLKAKGLYLPPQAKAPQGIAIPFTWARPFGDRVYVAGHGPRDQDGAVRGPFGRVGAEVTPEQGIEAAKFAMLSVLGSVKSLIGDLDRIAAWLRLEGYVLAAPGFDRTTSIVNGASDLLLDLFGPEIGSHARTAMGVAQTPLSVPVVIAAELAIRDGA